MATRVDHYGIARQEFMGKTVSMIDFGEKNLENRPDWVQTQDMDGLPLGFKPAGVVRVRVDMELT